MPILPLPQFEADLKALEEEQRLEYEKLKAPKTVVVRFGVMKMVAELPFDGAGGPKPGCGSKMVIRTGRGTELAELLTSTCPNAGCSKSVTRKEMLQYIENSGGKDYPFFADGRCLRIATAEDLARQTAIEQQKNDLKWRARGLVEQLALPMKIVEAEPILGGERITFYYLSEDRIDFRELVRLLAADLHTRIEMRQVGARDEARLTADYERCGQHCCCKQFLKVLKPVSMKSAKVQKATLDPLKISGRCGRLMCCLRYEDQTYDELAKRLPRKKTRVGTPEGDGWVVDTQILTQLVLVQLEAEDRQVAIAVEDLTDPGPPPPPPPPVALPRITPPPGQRPTPPAQAARPPGPPGPPAAKPPAPSAKPPQPPPPPPPAPVARDDEEDDEPDVDPAGPALADLSAHEARAGETPGTGDQPRKRRRRRRRGRRPPGDSAPPGSQPPPPTGPSA